MDVDRLLPPRLADERDEPLRLAERIGADHVGALGKQGHGGEKLCGLAARVGMAVDGQAEGRLRDEHVAGDGFERTAGRIGGALVVARGDDPAPTRLDRDLRRT